MEGVRGLTVTTNRIQSLRADFKGMENLDKVVDKVVRRLAARDAAQGRAALVKSGAMTLQDFDGWFAELVRVELGKTLGILRNKAVQKARNAGAGSASSYVPQWDGRKHQYRWRQQEIEFPYPSSATAKRR